jgi:hypothetical protein
MKKPRDFLKLSDVERPQTPVTDSIADDVQGEPLTVKLGDIWSDYVRGTRAGRDPDAPPRSSSGVPLLDDMKGILQWE